MVESFDHVTVVVEDVEAAKAFFALLGFVEENALLISGPKLSQYMGIADIEAEHITLVVPGSQPRTEMQLLKYHKPAALADAQAGTLYRLGFNHLCFRVDDIEAEVRGLKSHGVRLLNDIMEFNNRKLVFVRGPSGITVELAQRM